MVKQQLPVFWAQAAKERLKAIYEYYKAESPQGAANLRRDILASVSRIPVFPKKHQIDPDLGEPYRRAVIRHYHIVYHIREEGVFIVDIFDARQSPDKKGR